MALDFLQNSLLLVFALLPLFSQMQEEIEDLDLGMDKKKKVCHFSPVCTMPTPLVPLVVLPPCHSSAS